MTVLRIKSHSMREALDEARRRLGDDITVLQTKQIEEPALLGLVRKQGVEILATAQAVADSGCSRVHLPRNLQMTSSSCIGEGVSRYNGTSSGCAMAYRAPLGEGCAPSDRSPAVVERLVANGVSQKLAESLTPEFNLVQDYSQIINKLAQRICCSGPIGCKSGQARVALIGPTGVGKTTTAAKLAAQELLISGKSVALLTLDTYRVGAVEQLATYARILNIPIEVALCPEDVDSLVRAHADKDVIIIDTVGRSQRNSSHLAELARFVRAAAPTEVHLVVSASSSRAVQNEAVRSFGLLSPDRMIVSKLDECPQPGCILDLATNMLPFSYITCGQEVPDDIAVAESANLARLVWEGAI